MKNSTNLGKKNHNIKKNPGKPKKIKKILRKM